MNDCSKNIYRVIQKNPSGLIYFIQQQYPVGPIKIGFTERSVNKRLAQLQTAQAYPLSCIATMHGTMDDERELHWKFRSIGLRGEWFRPEQDLLDFIKAFTVVVPATRLSEVEGQNTPTGEKEQVASECNTN